MIIGLIGAKGSGKSTVFAKYLIDNLDFVSVSHSTPLKNMLKAIGCTEEEVQGSLKEKPCSTLQGVTPRRAMQTLGAEWGRDCIHPDLWVNLWEKEALKHPRVVADGVRFKNEVQKIKEMGGICIRVRRPSVEGTDSHSTELGANFLRADYEVHNYEDNPEKGLFELREVLRKENLI